MPAPVASDAAGNMVRIPVYLADNAPTNTYQLCVYDAWNRLVRIRTDTDDPNTTSVDESKILAEFEYDGLGRRIMKSVQNTPGLNATYYFYHDGQRVVEIHNGSEAVIIQRVWGRMYIDALCQTWINSDPLNDPDFSESAHVDAYYALHDANFNVTELYDAAGDLVERYSYDPYGSRQVYAPADGTDAFGTEPLPRSTRVVDDHSVKLPHGLNDIGHQGLMHDESLATQGGLIHNRARTLHPRLGRFLQRDPLGYVDGPNLYQYARSNPVRFRDPSGLQVGSQMVELGAKYGAYLEWYPQGGWGEIKIGKLDKSGRIVEEMMRLRYDRASGTVNQVLRHGGRELPGISRNALNKISPKILAATEKVVGRVGGTPTVTRLAPRPRGGGGGGVMRSIGGGLLSILMILDMTASPAYAPTIENPDTYPITDEDLGMSPAELLALVDEWFVVNEPPGNQTEGELSTPADSGKVVVASISACPKNFRPYEVQSGDNCWCLWRARTNTAVSWGQAQQQCAATATSGDADRLKIGETICVPE